MPIAENIHCRPQLQAAWPSVAVEVEEVKASSTGADTIVWSSVDADGLGPSDLAVQVWATREGQELCLDATARGRIDALREHVMPGGWEDSGFHTRGVHAPSSTQTEGAG